MNHLNELIIALIIIANAAILYCGIKLKRAIESFYRGREDDETDSLNM